MQYETKTAALRLLLVDDQAILREGLASLFSVRGGCEVAAVEPHEALRLADRFRPQVVLLDAELSGQATPPLTEDLARLAAAPRVVWLDERVNPRNLQLAVALRVAGYWTKQCGFADLAAAVQLVAKGGVAFSPAVAPHLQVTPDGLRVHAPEEVPPAPALLPPGDGTPTLRRLSPREREVFLALAHGWSLQRCADELKLSAHTVDNHKTSLMKKLCVHRTVDLVLLAAREGLIR